MSYPKNYGLSQLKKTIEGIIGRYDGWSYYQWLISTFNIDH